MSFTGAPLHRLRSLQPLKKLVYVFFATLACSRLRSQVINKQRTKLDESQKHEITV
jgi:hypothetical protein